MLEIISTGNDEIDRQFGGGLPAPSLMFIAGDHGTGKSALTAQMMIGLTSSKKRVMCVIENTVKQYLQKMKAITFNFTRAFVRNQILFVPIYIPDANWSEKNSERILSEIKAYMMKKADEYDVIILDSISPMVRNSSDESILNFLSFCKEIVGKGKTVIITSHSSDFSKITNTTIIGASDVYLKLGLMTVGDKEVKTLKAIKMLGAKDTPASGFAFEVDLIFGIKIVPVSMANA